MFSIIDYHASAAKHTSGIPMPVDMPTTRSLQCSWPYHDRSSCMHRPDKPGPLISSCIPSLLGFAPADCIMPVASTICISYRSAKAIAGYSANIFLRRSRPRPCPSGRGPRPYPILPMTTLPLSSANSQSTPSFWGPRRSLAHSVARTIVIWTSCSRRGCARKGPLREIM